MLQRIDAFAPLSILHYTYALTYKRIYVHLTCIFWSPYLLNVVVDIGCIVKTKTSEINLRSLRPKTRNRRPLHDLETGSSHHHHGFTKENQ